MTTDRERALDWINAHREERRGHYVGGYSENEWSALQERLQYYLTVLTPGEREAYLLVVGQGLKHRQAAELLSCSVKAVERRVARARAKLALGPDSLRAIEEDMKALGIKTHKQRELSHDEQIFAGGLIIHWAGRGLSMRETARRFGIDSRTARRWVTKALEET